MMNSPITPEKFYLSDDDVAARFGVSTDSIRRWIRQGVFPKPVRVGKGTSRWRLSDIERYEAGLVPAYCMMHLATSPSFFDAIESASSQN